MAICSIQQFETILANLVTFSDDLTSLEDIDIFLEEKYSVTLSDLLNNTDNKNSLDELKSVLDENYSFLNYNELIDPNLKEISTINNIPSNFRSPEVTPLFHTMQIAENYFKKSVNEKIINESLFGRGDNFVSNNVELNSNIKKLKNELFNTILSYLNKPKADLYDENGKFNLDNYNNLYQSTLLEFERSFDIYPKIVSYSGHKVPIIRASIKNSESRRLLDAYNAAVFLINFDNIIETEFSDLIQIDYSAFNNFKDSPDNSNKYSLKIKGIKELYWKGDTHLDESSEKTETRLTTLVVESIKELDKYGQFSGEYLQMKDFYSFAALLKDFELVNYNYLKENFPEWVPFNVNSSKALDWYLNNIEAFHSDKLNNLQTKLKIFSRPFENKLSFVKSLKQFFIDKNIDEKEKNSEGGVKVLLTQIINNTLGATYYTYNVTKRKFEVKEMHKHNANTIAMQNNLYSHILNNSEIFNNNQDKARIDKIITDLPQKLIDDNSGELLISDASIKKIGEFIRYKFGFFLTYDNIAKALLELKVNKEKLSEYLTDTSWKINESINAVKENNAKIDDNFAEVITESEVISEVINLPFVKEIINRYLDSYVLKPLMNIETLSGEKIPVFKVANLTYNDVSLMRSHEKSFEDKNYKNLFIDNKGAVLLGTGTKLEIIREDTNKAASKWSIAENFTGAIAYDFYKSLGNAFNNKDESTEKGFSIMIGNYSDKSTILTKIINAKHKLSDSNKYLVQESIDNILETVRTQSFNYYSDVFQNVFEQYNLLFKLINKSEQLNLDFRGDINVFNKNIQIISKYLIEENLDSDLELAFKNEDPNDRQLNFIEEIHYSKYTHLEKKVNSLNQLAIEYYKIFDSADLFNQFVNSQESEVIKKHQKTFKSNYIDFQETSSEGIKQYNEYVGEDYKEYKKNFTTKTKGVELNLIEVDGKLNPLVKKWLWINALYRNEYLYMSGKGEYMHPHKSSDVKYRAGNLTPIYDSKNKIKSFTYSEFTDSKINEFNSFFPDLQLEMSQRLSSMAKRNVAFTATIELPARRTKLGVPENINLAVIEDYESQVYVQSGISKNQEVHDGSSLINYVYSEMVNASYPSKGYGNTKKQFGTLVTPFGVIIKKDAETVINNKTIRDSNTAPIKLRDKQFQMFSIEIGDINFEKQLDVKNKRFFKNGIVHSIDSYIIEDGKIHIKTNKYIDGNISDQATYTYPAHNLFEIWEAFGGEFSTDENGEWSEGSNELLFDLVTSYKTPDILSESGDIISEGKYILKDKMIHVIPNKSAIKSGPTNLNKKKAWTQNAKDKLMYSTFEHRHMGPQLDAGHDSDGSEVREITQVISALAQNMDSAEKANEVYQSLAKIIEKAAEPYKKILFNGSSDDIFDYVSKKFFDTILTSKNVSLAKTIMESFPADVQIPYSNQNFFQLFVKDVITRMNNEFITRYYSGIGAVLNPSHNMIQIYEDKLGNTYSYSDLSKEALTNYNGRADDKTNNEIITQHISNIFQNESVSWDKIQPGDSIIIDDGSILTLDTIEKYYDFKRDFKNKSVTKSYSTPRDLKPSEITFNILVPPEINNLDLSSTKILRQVNIFDTESIRLRYALNKLSNPNTEKEVSELDVFKLKEFSRKFLIPWNLEDTKLLSLYLNAWTQRNMQLLESNRIMKDSDNFIIYDEITKLPISLDYSKLFGDDSLTNDILSDVLYNYNDDNIQEIYNYKFKAAELILPNLYRSVFNTGNKSISQIREQGPSFFKEKILNQFSSGDEVNDIKLILGNGDRDIYIRFVEHLPEQLESSIIKKDIEPVTLTDINGDNISVLKKVYIRSDINGDKLYTIPENASITFEGDKEIINIKAFTKSLYKDGDKSETFNKVDPNLSGILDSIISSFRGKISALVPLMNNKIEAKRLTDKNKLINDNINYITLGMFNRFSGFIHTGIKNIPNSDWLKNNIISITDQLGDKMYASWEKSLEFVAARIPSQSMQSFMEMKSVGYFDTDSNDAYVSVWQIFLQGSDFDIDKAYIIGYGFDKHAHYESTSDAFNYNSKSQLDAIEQLPMPSNIKTKFANTGVNLTDEFNIFNDYIIENPFLFQSRIYSDDVIKAFNKALRKISTLKINPTTKSKEVFIKSTASTDSFISIINSHNLSDKVVRGRHSLKNSIVSNIRQIISSPSNQLLANIPVDVKEWHDAVKEQQKLSNSDETNKEYLSSWDMFSMFKQQRDASVGKDDVGIAANGLKVFFALSNYYNNIYNKERTIEETPLQGDDLRKANHSFLKKLYIPLKDKLGNWIWGYKNFSTISDVNVSRSQVGNMKSAFGLNSLDAMKSFAALYQSSFTSAATDNAKELLMAKVNANVELASMHLYMLSLGMTPNQIAIFMNSKVGNAVVDALDVNLFKSAEVVLVPTVLSNLKKTLPKEFKEELKSFTDIYNGAQEFKILAKIFGVNQKTSANIIELHKYLSTFDKSIFIRERDLFGEDLKHLKNWNDWSDKSNTQIQEIKEKIAKKIIENNTTLNILTDIPYVISILDSASQVNYKDQKVSIIGGTFDFRKYFDETAIDKNGIHQYKETTKAYYNLIKNTINVFDVIEKVPHFKAMINGVVISHNILLKSSKKYNFVFNDAIDLSNKYARMLQRNNSSTIKNLYGIKELPLKFEETQIRRAMLAYDKFLVSKWTQSYGIEQTNTSAFERSKSRHISKISFNVANLLSLAGIDKLILAKNESAKYSAPYNVSNEFNDKSYIEVKKNIDGSYTNSDFNVDLLTDTGIANFKILMESVILEILKKPEYKNEFINSLRLQSLKNPYNLRTNQIVTSFNISELNNPINIEKFQNLLSDFNSIDFIKTLKNVNEEQMNWRDLFYLYNLFTNNESYGSKRLTPLFEDYMKERNSIGYDFLLYSSKVDAGEINIFDINQEIANEVSLAEKQIVSINPYETAVKTRDYNLLFYLYNTKGELLVDKEVGSKVGTKLLKLVNPNYSVTTSLIETSDTLDKLQNINRILNWVKSNSLVVTFKCD